jgi:hypothetical protein
MAVRMWIAISKATFLTKLSSQNLFSDTSPRRPIIPVITSPISRRKSGYTRSGDSRFTGSGVSSTTTRTDTSWRMTSRPASTPSPAPPPSHSVLQFPTMSSMATSASGNKRYLILDPHTKYSGAFRSVRLREGIHVIRLPRRSPNLNGFAERFVRSILPQPASVTTHPITQFNADRASKACSATTIGPPPDEGRSLFFWTIRTPELFHPSMMNPCPIKSHPRTPRVAHTARLPPRDAERQCRVKAW